MSLYLGRLGCLCATVDGWDDFAAYWDESRQCVRARIPESSKEAASTHP